MGYQFSCRSGRKRFGREGEIRRVPGSLLYRAMVLITILSFERLTKKNESEYADTFGAFPPLYNEVSALVHSIEFLDTNATRTDCAHL